MIRLQKENAISSRSHAQAERAVAIDLRCLLNSDAQARFIRKPNFRRSRLESRRTIMSNKHRRFCRTDQRSLRGAVDHGSHYKSSLYQPEIRVFDRGSREGLDLFQDGRDPICRFNPDAVVIPGHLQSITTIRIGLRKVSGVVGNSLGSDCRTRHRLTSRIVNHHTFHERVGIQCRISRIRAGLRQYLIRDKCVVSSPEIKCSTYDRQDQRSATSGSSHSISPSIGAIHCRCLKPDNSLRTTKVTDNTEKLGVKLNALI